MRAVKDNLATPLSVNGGNGVKIGTGAAGLLCSCNARPRRLFHLPIWM